MVEVMAIVNWGTWKRRHLRGGKCPSARHCLPRVLQARRPRLMAKECGNDSLRSRNHCLSLVRIHALGAAVVDCSYDIVVSLACLHGIVRVPAARIQGAVYRDVGSTRLAAPVYVIASHRRRAGNPRQAYAMLRWRRSRA